MPLALGSGWRGFASPFASIREDTWETGVMGESVGCSGTSTDWVVEDAIGEEGWWGLPEKSPVSTSIRGLSCLSVMRERSLSMVDRLSDE